MIVEVRKTHDKRRFDMRDRHCIGCACFSPGEYQHRGATLAGSRNTGAVSMTCLRHAYHGCPEDTGYSKELAAERKREGWSNP